MTESTTPTTTTEPSNRPEFKAGVQPLTDAEKKAQADKVQAQGNTKV